MISDKRMDAALNFLISSSDELAEAKATLVGLEEGRKSLKAKLMKASDAKTMDLKEADAYDHPDYRELVAGLVQATKASERLRLKREVALTICELWRTAQANVRAAERVR
jgi:hypothetical protein